MGKRNRGNVFTILLGGVVLASALSYMMYQTMAGPVASMSRVTKIAAAKSQMASLSSAVIGDAVNVIANTARQSAADCDADNYMEPAEWATGSGPTGGGILPTGLAPSISDPWGTTYGYCVWDVGTVGAAGCLTSGTQRRLAGSTTPLAGNPESQTVFAIVSAGADRKFQTTCSAYVDGTTNEISTTAGSDDIVQRSTYQEATLAAGDLWRLSNAAATAGMDKALSVTASDTSLPAIKALALTTDNSITATGGVMLGDQNKVTACNAGNAGLLRYDTGSGSAITVRAATSLKKEAASASTSSTVSFTTSPALHDTVIVAITGRGTGGAFTITSVTDNQGNSYSIVGAAASAGNSKAAIYAAYDIGSPSGTFTITVNYSGGTTRAVNFGALAVSGLAQTADNSDVKGTNTANNSSSLTVTSTGNAPTTQSNDFAVAVHGYEDATGDVNVNYVPEAGWTHVFFNNDAYTTAGLSAVYKVIPTAVAPSHSWSYHNNGAGSEYVMGAITTFKGASATAGTAALDFCDGGGSTWTAVGSGGGGALDMVTNINTLFDGVTDYAANGTCTLCNIGLGLNGLASASGVSNTSIGYNALNATAAGARNTALGYSAGKGIASTNDNTHIGSNTGGTNATGASSTGVGVSSLSANTSTGSTGFGYQALKLNTSGVNTAFGKDSLAAVTTGTRNTGFGYQALKATTGDDNTGFGYNALSANTSGSRNSAFGHQALMTSTTDSDNTAFGYNALALFNAASASATGNTALGASILSATTTGVGLTAAGYTALAANTTGNYNTAAGVGALANITTPSGITAAGRDALGSDTLGTGNTAAGHNALGKNSYVASGVEINVVQTSSRVTDINVTSSTSSFGTLPTTGNTIIVVIAGYMSGGFSISNTGVTDNQGGSSGSYLEAYAADSNCGGDARTKIFYRSNISAPSGTFTITAVPGGSSYMTWAAIEVAGLANAGVVDRTGKNNTVLNSDTSLTITGSGSLAQNYELLVSGITDCSVNANANLTPGAGWTMDFVENDGANYNPAAFAHKIVNATTTPDITWTFTAPGIGTEGGVLATFKGANTSPPTSLSCTPGTTCGNSNTAAGNEALKANTTGDENTAAGQQAMPYNTTGSSNTAAGYLSLPANTSGSANTVLGQQAMLSNTTGSYNTMTGDVLDFGGNVAMQLNTTGSYNTVVGCSALSHTVSSDNNVALGAKALDNLTSGTRNTALGHSTLDNITTGVSNTAVGEFAGGDAVSGGASYNTLIGRASGGSALNTAQYNTGDYLVLTTGSYNSGGGDAVTTGSYNTGHMPWSATATGSYNSAFVHVGTATPVGYNFSNMTMAGYNAMEFPASAAAGNTAIGTDTLMGNTLTGINNTAVGYQALTLMRTGNYDTAFGTQAIKTSTATSNSTAVGYNALGSLTSGNGNTAAGSGALSTTLTTGGNNTGVGYNASVNAAARANAVAIGYAAAVDADNKIVFGLPAGTSYPATAVYTNGTFQSVSDRRLKKDIAESDLGLDFIMKLAPVSYRLITGNGKLDYGFIAQDVQKALGRRVTNIARQNDDSMKAWMLGMEELTAPLVKALQEREVVIESQQAQIDDLKNQIDIAEKAVSALAP